MMRMLGFGLATALAVGLVPQGSVPVEAAEAAQKPKPKPSKYDSYLALGDSIPFGKGKTKKLQGSQTKPSTKRKAP